MVRSISVCRQPEVKAAGCVVLNMPLDPKTVGEAGVEDDELMKSAYREELNRALVTLAEACIEKNEDCNPSRP